MAQIKYIIPFTYKWEGGLSRATTDTASKNPSPYTYKGQTGWHTNKGVTYSSFKSLSPKLGYKDTADNFLNMPEDIWLKIAKNGYWDKLNLDAVKSQAVANLLFSWQWGSGYAWIPRVSRYLKTKGIEWVGGSYVNKVLKLAPDFNQIADKLNLLIDKQGEKKTFDELVEQKKQFLLSLGQPANEKGWLNRLEDLRKYSYGLIGKIKQNPIPTAIITASLIVGLYILIKTIKK